MPGLILATGHHRNGILLAPITAELVAGLLLDGAWPPLAQPFGVARFAKSATRTYTKVGTLGYIAPEQAYGRPRFASDVFSLGLVPLQG